MPCPGRQTQLPAALATRSQIRFARRCPIRWDRTATAVKKRRRLGACRGLGGPWRRSDTRTPASRRGPSGSPSEALGRGTLKCETEEGRPLPCREARWASRMAESTDPRRSRQAPRYASDMSERPRRRRHPTCRRRNPHGRYGTTKNRQNTRARSRGSLHRRSARRNQWPAHSWL